MLYKQINHITSDTSKGYGGKKKKRGGMKCVRAWGREGGKPPPCGRAQGRAPRRRGRASTPGPQGTLGRSARRALRAEFAGRKQVFRAGASEQGPAGAEAAGAGSGLRAQVRECGFHSEQCGMPLKGRSKSVTRP